MFDAIEQIERGLIGKSPACRQHLLQGPLAALSHLGRFDWRLDIRSFF